MNPKRPTALNILLVLNGFLFLASLQNALILYFLYGLNNVADIFFLVASASTVPLVIVLFYAVLRRKSYAQLICQIRSYHLALFVLSGIAWMISSQLSDIRSDGIMTFETISALISIISTAAFVGMFAFLHFYLLSREKVKKYFQAP